MRIRKLLLALLLAPPAEAQSARERQYLSLAEATLRRPIAFEELRAAILSPEGVDTVGRLFEHSVAEGLVLDGRLVTAELGGEATLDRGRLIPISYPDPIHPILRRMLELRSEPAGLLSFLQSSAGGKEILTGTGGLHAILHRLSTREPEPQELDLLRRILDSAVATYFKTWSTDPEIQARMIETTDWSGRYVGFWHLHPPRLLQEELASGIEPSYEDMSQAIELGQFLTIVFQPDGFDAYDLSPLGNLRSPDLSRVRIIQHRSADWRPRFEARVRGRLRE